MKSDLRVELTRRMLKEGLLRCMEHTPLSHITVSALCKEAGVNRTTFYNHYESPVMLLRDIANGYARELVRVYETALAGDGRNALDAVEEALGYLHDKRGEMRVLFSPNAEGNLTRFGMEIVDELVASGDLPMPEGNWDDEERRLYAVVVASACYGLMRTWLMDDIDKTPEELVGILRRVFGKQLA